MKTSDIVISGGGIPGLTLGCLLGQAGFTVSVIEPSPLPKVPNVKPSGRTSALMEDSLDILKEAGIWSAIEDRVTDLQILSIIDHDLRTDFLAQELGKLRFGANIPNALLQAYLAENLNTLETVSLFQTSLATYSADESYVVAELKNGQSIRTRLLIGADGRNSIVRTAAGIDCRVYDYDQMAITALLSHTKPHHYTSTEFHLPGGPFTLVPMPGLTSSLVWLEHTDKADQFLRLNKKEFEQVIQDRSEGILGEISLLSDPESWPLKLMAARSCTGHRVALIAEAVHVLSPIGAQGLNLSLRDARSLYEQIITARDCGLDYGSAAVLRKYKHDRQMDTALRVVGTHGLNQMVATDNPLLAAARRMGFKAVSSVPPLRALIMEQGFNAGQARVSGRTTRAKVTTSTR